MVNKDLLAAKLTELADRMGRVRAHVPANVAALRADRDRLDLVAFKRGVLEAQTAEAMRKAVGLRNVVAGYAGIDVDACFRAAAHGLADLEAFASSVGRWAHITTAC